MNVLSCFIEDSADLRAGVPMHQLEAVVSATADLQIQVDSTGRGTHAMYIKQLESLGCPTWRQPPRQNPMHVDVWLCTSDQGPDQIKARQIIRAEVAAHGKPNVMFWEWGCTMHNAQLIIRDSLDVIDEFLKAAEVPWRYFSLIAKTVNVWRDNGKKLFDEWLRQWGPESAMLHAYIVPHRCLAGRWHHVVATERRFLKFGRDIFVPVFREVLVRRKPGGGNSEDALLDADAGVDELRVESQAAYRAKLGRWAREAVAGLSCDLFWQVLDIATRVHGVADHIMNFIHDVPSMDSVDMEGRHVSRLACGKAVAFLEQYAELLGGDAFNRFEELWPGIPIHDLGQLHGLFILLVLNQAGGWHRRVVCRVSQCLPRPHP